jgi:hypothetical protein
MHSIIQLSLYSLKLPRRRNEKMLAAEMTLLKSRTRMKALLGLTEELDVDAI